MYVHAFYYLLDHVARALLLNDLSLKFRAARIRALARLALSGGAVLNTLALVQCHGKSRTIPWQSTQYWYLKQIPTCALHHYYILLHHAHICPQTRPRSNACGYDLNFSYPGFHRITDVHGCSCPQSDLWQFMCIVWVLPHPHLYPVGMRTDSPGPRCTPHRRTPMVGCLQMPREPSRRGIQWGRFSEVSEMDCSIRIIRPWHACTRYFFFQLTVPCHPMSSNVIQCHPPFPQWLLLPLSAISPHVFTAAKRRKICCEKPMRKCITAWASVAADVKGGPHWWKKRSKNNMGPMVAIKKKQHVWSISPQEIPFFRTSTQISIVFPIFDGSCCILWDLRSASLRWWFALYQSWYQTWQVGKWTVEWMGMNGVCNGMYLLSKNVKYSKMFINFDRFPEWNRFLMSQSKLLGYSKTSRLASFNVLPKQFDQAMPRERSYGLGPWQWTAPVQGLKEFLWRPKSYWIYFLCQFVCWSFLGSSWMLLGWMMYKYVQMESNGHMN